MRFTPGQKELFMFLDYSSNPRNPSFFPLYRPWTDTLYDIKIHEFTCQSHHRVPGEWDDVIQYDGFIFTDHFGAKWNNQYPRASYGQISTERDSVITPSMDGLTLKEGQTAMQYLLAMHSRRELMHGWVLLSEALDRILRGIDSLSQRRDSEEEISSLQVHYDAIVTKVREDFKKDVVSTPYTMTTNDGETIVVPGHFKFAYTAVATA